QLSAEEQILKRCRDREEYYLDLRAYEREVAESKKIIEEDKKMFAERAKLIAEDKKIIAEKDAKLAENEKTINALLDEIEMLKSNTGK
ncbi:MAG: hypothetical protein NC231_02350, partial [Bacillus sp. (in: Bacteria)]|nr:hypothetical protein [Bacillus sp. (in: firmicutes)]